MGEIGFRVLAGFGFRLFRISCFGLVVLIALREDNLRNCLTPTLYPRQVSLTVPNQLA
jgi:hypothetical protein